ncbi:hypothetical protein Q1695_010825 [Nippostrongylus brasiliensis]|nr:hypothetical protein Q1695_010825 [Nippostrongylus brasiliensis]
MLRISCHLPEICRLDGQVSVLEDFCRTMYMHKRKANANSSYVSSALFRRVLVSNELVNIDGDSSGNITHHRLDNGLYLSYLSDECIGCDDATCSHESAVYDLDLAVDELRSQLRRSSTRLFADIELVILLYAMAAFFWLFFVFVPRC